jgi:hypothetical protein
MASTTRWCITAAASLSFVGIACGSGSKRAGVDGGSDGSGAIGNAECSVTFSGFVQYQKCMGQATSLGDLGSQDACLAACKADTRAFGCWYLDGTGGFSRDCRICTDAAPSTGTFANDWAGAIVRSGSCASLGTGGSMGSGGSIDAGGSSSPGGTKHNGDACEWNNECISGWCTGVAGQQLHCSGTKSGGSSCSSSDECKTGLSCSGGVCTTGSSGSGGSRGSGGSTGTSACDSCLATCRGLASCCTGSGCICQDECLPPVPTCTGGKELVCDDTGFCMCM